MGSTRPWTCARGCSVLEGERDESPRVSSESTVEGRRCGRPRGDRDLDAGGGRRGLRRARRRPDRRQGPGPRGGSRQRGRRRPRSRSRRGIGDRQRPATSARRHGQRRPARPLQGRRRQGRRQPAGQDLGHLPDRRGGPGDREGAHHRRPRHRQGVISWPRRRSRLAVPGLDGDDRGWGRYRDRRPRLARKNPPRADRRPHRPRPVPGPQGV